MSTNGKTKPSPDCRIAVLGRAGVGKSALVVRFLTKRFIWEYDPTLECTYRHTFTLDDEVIAIEVLDTAGQTDTVVREGQVRWADGFILVYSINDRRSFEEINQLKQYLDDIKKTNIQCVLVGNKVDLVREREVNAVDGMKLATDWACAFFETSASDGSDDINELFCELTREVKRRKQIENKSRRRSSAQSVKQVLTKMFNTSKQNNRQNVPT